jgi:hypothetical protein
VSTIFFSAKKRILAKAGQVAGKPLTQRLSAKFLKKQVLRSTKQAERLAGAESELPRPVELLEGFQCPAEAFQEKRSGIRFADFRPAGMSKTAQQFGNAPQIAFARLFAQDLEHVMAVGPLCLGLKIIRYVLLEVLQRDGNATDAARAGSPNHDVGATEPVPRFQ